LSYFVTAIPLVAFISLLPFERATVRIVLAADLVLLAAHLVAASSVRARCHDLVTRSTMCEQCAYPLPRENARGVCPECGLPFEMSHLAASQKARYRLFGDVDG
jgi:uncharacterized paraquat-inducible protein A